MRGLLLALVMVTACSGDTPPNVDANPLGPRCTKQLYDLCVEEHDCLLMVCQNFAAQGFQVCTQGCDGITPCPNDRTGSPAACMNNVCTPAAANMCHL